MPNLLNSAPRMDRGLNWMRSESLKVEFQFKLKISLKNDEKILAALPQISGMIVVYKMRPYQQKIQPRTAQGATVTLFFNFLQTRIRYNQYYHSIVDFLTISLTLFRSMLTLFRDH